MNDIKNQNYYLERGLKVVCLNETWKQSIRESKIFAYDDGGPHSLLRAIYI